MIALGICLDLDPELVFLTDCSTRFNISCLAKLTYGLMMKNDLIGVTARYVCMIMKTEPSLT